ncbi:MAG: ABC transporter permease, partial [Weissella confusa]|nr:ABC transporter permease [Weissella confusa]
IAGLLVNVFAPHYKYLKMIKELLAGVDAGFAIMTLLIALVAIFMYMVLTAIVAAMVNDLSQVQQAVAPITYLAMIGYVLTFTLSGQPNNTFLNILSYVPFISQTLMPARLGLQYATMGDAAIALVLEVIVLVFISMFGLRVYKRNVLTYNDGNITKAALASLKGLFVKKKD